MQLNPCKCSHTIIEQLMKSHIIHELFTEYKKKSVDSHSFDISLFITGLHSYIKYKNLNEKSIYKYVQNLRLYYTDLTINKGKLFRVNVLFLI